ncbi:hypothetical protein RvY_06851 [Ramazzottius varieornatus]|uniref:Receptor ligand binding region domain-containing protein n=1 Tax=Ramazzottius varieornatus TaxID=947166 RepID=A0A1D1V0D7_RAMVA|nr:hypothetical protein RvY_06851 [Ramazzottius varieornatus]
MATLTRIGPAFDSGIRNLQRYENYFSVSHRYLSKKSWTDCGKLEYDTQDTIAKWYYDEIVTDNQSQLVIITPGCSEVLYLNQLAANWNILLMTTTTSNPVIRDKSKSPTWVSTNFYPSLWYGDVFYGILQLYRWTSVYVILDENAVVYYINGAAVTMRYLKANHFRTVYFAYDSRENELDFARTLAQMRTETRGGPSGIHITSLHFIYNILMSILVALIFFGHPPQVRRLLIAAHRLNMTGGEFVFIATHLFPGDIFGNFTWRNYNDDDKAVRTAYQSLLLVVGAETNRHSLISTKMTEEVEKEFITSYLTNPLYNNTDLHYTPK